jgi:hypothetical protein
MNTGNRSAPGLVEALEQRYPSLRRHVLRRLALRLVVWSSSILLLYGGLWVALAFTGADEAKVSERAIVETAVVVTMLVAYQVVRWLTLRVRGVSPRDTTPNTSLERTREE